METTLTDPISQLAAEYQGRESQKTSNGTELGRDDFLSLLVAKMEHQDPLDPAQDTEFIEQLATFSSLEQLISVNENLNSLAIGQANLVNAQALDLIGKEALVEAGDTLTVKGSVPDTLVYALPPEATTAQLIIHDPAEKEPRVIDLDASKAGRVTIDWNAVLGDELLEDGTYTITYAAQNATGDPVAMGLFRSLPIDGVNFLDGGISLVSGDEIIPFASILEYRAGS